MVRCLEKREAAKIKAGRDSELSLQDQVLLTLEYLREYVTLFRLGVDWGIHETTAGRVVHRVESALLEHGFKLPGKKKLQGIEGMNYEVVVIDVGESPIERPKKNSADTTQARRNAIL
jgi:hypothetical protein